MTVDCKVMQYHSLNWIEEVNVEDALEAAESAFRIAQQLFVVDVAHHGWTRDWCATNCQSPSPLIEWITFRAGEARR